MTFAFRSLRCLSASTADVVVVAARLEEVTIAVEVEQDLTVTMTTQLTKSYETVISSTNN
jgi:hypothetical protein